MSTLPDDESGSGARDTGLEIEALAQDFIALVEEFETTISEGHVPPAFEERLAQLKRTAERLLGP